MEGGLLSDILKGGGGDLKPGERHSSAIKQSKSLSTPNHKSQVSLVKAKAGNLNLFLRILPFVSLKIAGKTREKREQNAQKKV